MGNERGNMGVWKRVRRVRKSGGCGRVYDKVVVGYMVGCGKVVVG